MSPSSNPPALIRADEPWEPSPGSPSALVFEGFGSPCDLGEDHRRLLAGGIPWIAYSGGSAAALWVELGAWGLVPPGTPVETALGIASRLASRMESSRGASPLTGLPGNEEIASVLEREVVAGSGTAAYLDIADFKPFNDYCGFEAGDAAIRLLALCLSSCLPGFFVGHVGGDDFVAVGSGERFISGLEAARARFRREVLSLYGERDRAAGGIEALDRDGVYRSFGFLDTCCVTLTGSGCRNAVELAGRAGEEKKRLKGQSPPARPWEAAPPLEDIPRWAARSLETGLLSEDDLKAFIEACGVSRNPSMEEPLRRILADMSLAPGIRKSAAAALGRIAGPAGSEAVRESLLDPSPHVRTMAVEALPQTMGAQAGPLLHAAAGDRSTWVRRAALRGLGAVGAEGAAERLLEAASSGAGGRTELDREREASAAMEGLARLGSREAGDALLASCDPAMRRDPWFWRALASSGGEAAILELAARVRLLDPLACSALDSVDPSRISAAAQLEGACTVVVDSGRFVEPALSCLSRIPGQPGRILRSRIGDWLCTLGGRSFEILAGLIEARRVDLREAEVVGFTRRIMSGGPVSASAAASILRAVAGSGSARPGWLRRLLRHPRVEIRMAASEAVSLTLRNLLSKRREGGAESDSDKG